MLQLSNFYLLHLKARLSYKLFQTSASLVIGALCLILLFSFLWPLKWNSKRDLPGGAPFTEVTRKQHPSQLAVHACIIPRCQKCSWRTNRQPVSSSSSSKNCQNHRCTRNHLSIKLFTFLFQSSVWQLRSILALAAETVYLSGFKSYRGYWNLAH